MVPSPLLLELLSCPLCARSLETLELELGDLEGGRGEADGLQCDFPQVRMKLMMMDSSEEEGCTCGVFCFNDDGPVLSCHHMARGTFFLSIQKQLETLNYP